MRSCVCVTHCDSGPKAEMEEPTLRALATERLAERGARIEKQQPTADNSARRLQRANWAPSLILSAGATPRLAPSRADTWQDEGSAKRLSHDDAIDFSSDQGCFLILASTFGCSDDSELSASNSAAVWVRRGLPGS